METPEGLRRRAEETEEFARQISLSTDREKMLVIARRWRKRADALEAQQQNKRSSD
jgi:hypothetical protein